MSEIEDTEPLEPDASVEAESGADDGETAAETAARVYAGKFNSDDDLEKGYLESEKRGTQAAQEAAELREQLAAYEAQQAEPAFDPWAHLGTGVDESTSQQIYQSLYNDPQGTMEWAMHPETQKTFGPQITDQVYAAWQQLQPWQAQAFAAKHTATQEIAQTREELAQTRAEQEARNNREITNTAFSIIKDRMPDIGEHKQRVVELMDMYPLPDNDPRLQDPDSMAQYISHLRGIARDEAFQREQVAAAQVEQAAKPAAGARARTQTRSTAAAGGTQAGDPVTQAYQDAMAAG